MRIAHPEPRAEPARGAHHQIVVLRFARKYSRKRAGQCQAIAVGTLDRHDIAVAAKGEQRLQFVIAIVAATTDMECQIDLGRGGLDDSGHAHPMRRTRPHGKAGQPAIFAASRACSPSSAVSAAARQA